VAALAARYLNRELSMLDYHARVLARAEDAPLPLIERVRFLGHFATGLDDFYQIRVAGLKEQQEAAPSHASPDGRTPGEQLSEIRQHVDRLVQRQTHVFREELLPVLAEAGVRVVSVGELGKRDLHLAIQSELRRHRRRASAVRLEVNPDVPADVLALLVRELELRDEDVHTVEGTLDINSAANFLADLDKPQLKLRTQPSGSASALAPYEDRPSELFAALQKSDILVHHPYETFASS